MICAAGSRGEEKIIFNDHPVHSLWSQMHSGWSVLVFGQVTRFHKEVPGLTFRSIGNNRLFSTLQPLCLPFSPLALLAPWSLLTQGTSHTAPQWVTKIASQASCFRLICLAVHLTTTVLSLEDCWIQSGERFSDSWKFFTQGMISFVPDGLKISHSSLVSAQL